LTTFNVWFDSYFADQRYRAIAQLLSGKMPDVMVFQEITPTALSVFLAQPWIREHYRCAAVVGGKAGNYGMLMLSRLPTTKVTYRRLPTRLSRGFLQAEFTVNGRQLVVCSVHLESGKRRARLRGRQLRRVFRALRSADDAIVLGDFNMRDTETCGSPRPITMSGRCYDQTMKASPKTPPSTTCDTTARTNTDRFASTARFSRDLPGLPRAST
jgi:endonuclease/exonuclease/phosphatase family metal-dependent hydrolase